MADLFDEVDEQLRSDQIQTLARRAAPIITIVLAVTLVVYLGYWGFKAYQDRNLTAASNAYQQGVDALGQSDNAGAQKAFAKAVDTGAPGYKTLALMQEGALSLAKGKTTDAVSFYDQASKAAPNPILGDFAALRAAQILLDTASLGEEQARLKPLIDAKRPYTLYAREALAMAELMAGQTKQARRDFSVLSLSLGVPDDMRQRCQVAMDLIDAGEGPTAVAAVKAAATLPPPPAANVATPPPGTQGQGGSVQSSPPSGVAQ